MAKAASRRPSPFAILLPLVSLSACANILGFQDFVTTGDDAGEAEAPSEAPLDASSGDTSRGPDATEAAPHDAVADTPDSTLSDVSDSGDGRDSGDALVADTGPRCTPGGNCTPASPCYQGTYTCGDAGAVCSATTAMGDGTPCGSMTGFVCKSGSCVACAAGADCSDPSAPCVKKTYDCRTGTAVCSMAGNAVDGTSCNGTMYCYSGVCSACTVNASCSPSGQPCHVGKVTSCAGGTMICTDQNMSAAAGAACQTGSVASGVCDSQGNCVSCTPNASCSPPNTPCKTGTMSCSAGPVCNPTNNINEGLSCGTGSICVAGSCVACDATNCANGCCNSTGCIAASAQLTSTCGTGASGGMCQACPAPTGSGTATCSGNACGYSCASGYHPCSPNTCADNTSPNTCGSACSPCQLANATAGCDGTQCTIQACSANYGDCDGVASNGCETNLLTSTTYCGSCGSGHACATGGSCSNGTCSCPTGQVNCNGACTNLQSDGNNCGRCTHKCGFGSCGGGTCSSWSVASSSTAMTPQALVSDGSSVIWADKGLMKILQVPTSGMGTPTTLSQDSSFSTIPSGTFTPLAIGSGIVTWITSTNVWKATVGGTTNNGVKLPFTFPSPGAGNGLLNLAMNSGASHVGVMNEFGSGPFTFEFYDCPLSASACTDVSAALGNPLGYYQQGAVANGSAMYFADFADNQIRVFNFGSTSIGILETNQSLAGGIAIDSSSVYWATNTQIVKAALAGGSVTPLGNLPGGGAVAAILGMATDGTNVYFTTSGTPAQVAYVPTAGCCPSPSNCCGITPIVQASNPASITAPPGSGMIFWIDGSNITGMAVP